MIMKRKYWILIIVLLSLIAFYFVYLRRANERELINKGNDIVKMVEDFRSKNGKLPESLHEIGIKEKEDGPLYYEKWDSVDYIVYFGTSLGESMTYYSDKKEWNKQIRIKE